MPRIPKELKDTRDTLVMRMFIAGMPYKDIGANNHVNLSAQGVHNVVKAQMKKSAQRREFIADNAYEVHMERLESLYAANYAKAVGKDTPAAERLKAGELCRRILGDLGKIHGIDASATGEAPPPRDNPDFDDDTDEDDELGAYRKRSRGA